ncbi:MAG: type II and III secretion system protein family protein [Gammaproteobacteria bacterium]|nr:type II and III secretion system protein family protein [Gammaproteobacteria bacterium]
MSYLKTLTRRSGLIAAVALLAFPWMVQAQQAAVTPSLRGGNSEALVVPLFKSKVVRLEEPAARISVGSPDIADILVLKSTQLYVLGKDLGTTNVLLWDRNDQLIGTVAVEVTHDLESLKAKLHELLPDETILVYSSQRSIVLAGRVSSALAMNSALRIADGYLAQLGTATKETEFKQESMSKREDKAVGEIINLMEVAGAQQVMLSVKVAEIARTEMRSLDTQFNAAGLTGNWKLGGVNGGARFPDVVFTDSSLGAAGRVPVLRGDAPFGPVINEFAPNAMTIDDKGLFASFLSDDFLFNMALNVAKDKGLAKILAEPTLTTLTGQEASFLSGGEFPIPVPQGNDSISIEFKEFGVGLTFLPVVLGSGAINLSINVSVSELVQANNVLIDASDTLSRFVIPSLSKRSTSTTVELKDGQTIAIAGLINESLREAVNKFPGLGDLPILGYLFRSQAFQKGETELLIAVTPRLAKPIAPQDLRLPTDSFVEPSDSDFYIMGRMEGKKPASTAGDTGTPAE